MVREYIYIGDTVETIVTSKDKKKKLLAKGELLAIEERKGFKEKLWTVRVKTKEGHRNLTLPRSVWNLSKEKIS